MRLRELTMAFAAPVNSSKTSVEPGSPPVSHEFRGTETTFIVVPTRGLSEVRAGINRAVWFNVGMDVRCGVKFVGGDFIGDEREEKTLAIRTWSSVSVNLDTTFSTSERERTRSDMVVRWKVASSGSDWW